MTDINRCIKCDEPTAELFALDDNGYFVPAVGGPKEVAYCKKCAAEEQRGVEFGRNIMDDLEHQGRMKRK